MMIMICVYFDEKDDTDMFAFVPGGCYDVDDKICLNFFNGFYEQ